MIMRFVSFIDINLGVSVAGMYKYTGLVIFIFIVCVIFVI